MARITLTLTSTKAVTPTHVVYSFQSADGQARIDLGWHPTQAWAIAIPCTKGLTAAVARRLALQWEKKTLAASGSAVSSLMVNAA